MWTKISVGILLAVVLVVCSIFALPYTASNLATNALREQTGAEDVQISITDSPRLVFGEVGAIDGVLRQGRIGKIFVRELTVTGTHLRFDVWTLLREQKLELMDAGSITLRGVVDADAIRELITNNARKFEKVAVTITPGGILTTAKTRALGQTFEVTLDGSFVIVSGDLYYKANRITARGMGLNALSLDGLFPDVLVARADAMPLGLAFQTVETKDGIVVLTAGK